MRLSCFSIVAAALTFAALAPRVTAVEIDFGGNAHGLTGESAAQFSAGPFGVSVEAGPSGAVFFENAARSLGIDTRGVVNAVDLGETYGPDKFNLLGGDAGFGGAAETMTFWFDRPGVLQSLLFDGVKDETLEYFRLELPTGEILSIFDFELELRLNQQGFDLGDLTVPGITLAQDAADDALELNIPFAAGERFVLSFGSHPFPDGYVPFDTDQPPNGAEFEGFVVVVPEPNALLLVTIIAAAAGPSRRRRRARRTSAPRNR